MRFSGYQLLFHVILVVRAHQGGVKQAVHLLTGCLFSHGAFFRSDSSRIKQVSDKELINSTCYAASNIYALNEPLYFNSSSSSDRPAWHQNPLLPKPYAAEQVKTVCVLMFFQSAISRLSAFFCILCIN